MSKRYELSLGLIDLEYVDRLVVALARQGYAPYINLEDKVVCIEISSCELTEIKAGK